MKLKSWVANRIGSKLNLLAVGTLLSVFVPVALIAVEKVKTTMDGQVGLMAKTIAEALAGASTESILLQDYPALETLAKNTVVREDDLMSVIIRRKDSRVVASAHSRHAKETENWSHFKVPILVHLQDGQSEKMGSVELGWSNDRVAGTVASIGFQLFAAIVASAALVAGLLAFALRRLLVSRIHPGLFTRRVN